LVLISGAMNSMVLRIEIGKSPQYAFQVIRRTGINEEKGYNLGRRLSEIR